MNESDFNKRTSKKMVITCSYARATVPLAGLPTFISFKPDNKLTVTLTEATDSTKVKRLFEIISTWFEELKIIRKDIIE